MSLIKNIKIDRSKIIEFSIVLTTLFLVVCILYSKFITGNYIFGSGDYLAPKMISESIKNLTSIYGEFPYWLPSNFGGMPTIHSLQGISDYYMPNYIIQLFGLPGIWTQLIHLIFAGLGVYVLLRYLNVNFLTALFGGVMFLMTPYMNVCIVHGHGSQLMTAAYIPWVCWALLKLSKTQNLKNLGLLGILLGFQLQRGHIQVAYYTWLIIGIFVLYKLATSKFSLKFYSYLIGSTIAGFLMAISIIWPSYIYSEHSIRGAGQGAENLSYFTDWSFSFSEMITFIIPSYYGFGGATYWGTMGEHQTDFPNYLGVFVIIFTFYGLFKLYKNKNYIFFIILTLFFLLLSMGKNFFLFDLLFNYMPFFNKFRAPMMALMVFQFGFIILATLGFNQFIKNLNNHNNPRLFFKMFAAISAILISILFIIIPSEKNIIYSSEQLNELFQPIVKDMIYSDIYSLIFILLIALILFGILLYNTIKNNVIYRAIGITVIGLSTIDLYLVNSSIIEPDPIKIKLNVSKDPTQTIYESQEISQSKVIALEKIDSLLSPLRKFQNNKDVSKFRIYSQTGYPSAGRTWAAYAGLHDISGYHPAKLNNYAKFEGFIIDFIKNGTQSYPISNNIVKLLNLQQRINWTDVRQPSIEVLSNYGFETFGQAFFVDKLKQYKEDNELLTQMNSPYFNPSNLSYTKNNIPEFEPKHPDSKIINYNWSPNKIEIEVDIKNYNHFIGLSEIYYPNWEITSHDIDIIQINGLLRGFVAPAGKHTIVMEFNHDDVKYANMISFFSFIIMLLCILSTFLLTKINELFKK